MANSGTVTAGSAALASQYNNLRADVLSITTGHGHSGVGEDGKAIVSGGVLKYEQFTSSGSFVIPASASSSAIIVLEMMGAGCGGSGGFNRGSGTAAGGGLGGNGGHFRTITELSSTYGTAGGTVTVTIGAGGAGGTGTNVTPGTGGLGGNGGATSFGTSVVPGQFQQSNDSRPGIDFGGNLFFYNGQASDTDITSGTIDAATLSVSYRFTGGYGAYSASGQSGFRSGFDNEIGGGGGGSGGGITAANVSGVGGNGGKSYPAGGVYRIAADGDLEQTFGNGGAGGTASGGVGGTAASSGGGGGGGNNGGNGGTGGAGAQPGGGGGGGGAARTGNTSGAGGAGGSGRVRVWVIG